MMKNTYRTYVTSVLFVASALGACDEGGVQSEVSEGPAPLSDPLASTAAEQGSLASSFALSGCGLPPLCQLTATQGQAWQAVCGTQKIGGADASQVSPFTLADGRVCTGAIEDGVLSGQCTGGDAGSCTFASRSELLPTPYCVELPRTLTNVDICANPPANAQQIKATKCEIVQNECSFQARCEGGAVFAGNVTPTGVRWDPSPNYRCVGKLEGDALTGTCTERGLAADAGAPQTCALSAGGTPPPAACEQDLPKPGFVLHGCGYAGTICTVGQRGCIWQATCGNDVYRARVAKPGVYEFTLRGGARCTAQVRDGVFTGSCGEGDKECALTTAAPAPANGCLTLPKSGLNTVGCGPSLGCEVLQNGCDWQAFCGNANGSFIYKGTALPAGVLFEGQNNFKCWANKEAGSERLVGGCSRSGTQVSECAERLENGGLALTPR